MTGRVGVHPVPVVGLGVLRILEESCAEGNGPTMRRIWVDHMEIDMNLLRFPIRPIRRNVARCTLHAKKPVPLVVDDWVELRIVVQRKPVKHGSPECALGFNVCSIEHDDVADTVHG